MYAPSHFHETRLDVLHSLIERYPLGTLITVIDGEITANHVPFLIEGSDSGPGILKCHVAKANPVWRELSNHKELLVAFQGCNAYVSPSWYPSKYEHGKAVPTWNYTVAHARGIAQTTTDREWLLQHVRQLSDTHEAKQVMPWQVSDAPTDYIDKMLGAIVGIEISLSSLEGKWKVSQNRSESDRVGVVAGLESMRSEDALAMSDIIQGLAK